MKEYSVTSSSQYSTSRSLTAVRNPGDQLIRYVAAVDQALLVQADEGLAHRPRQAVVEGEALARPIARGAQAAELVGDDPAVLPLPLPRPLDEVLAPELLAGDLLGPQQLLLHLKLGGDPGVVGAGHPQGGSPRMRW